jgi:hypothetical protein
VATHLGHFLAQCVFLVIEVIDAQIGDRPIVHLAEQGNVLRRKHWPNQVSKVLVVEVMPAVDGLKDLDGGLQEC